jgi:hypothetical protein
LSSSVTAAIVASPLPTAAPASLTVSRNDGAFGKVLSAKLSGPVTNSQGPFSSAHQESAKKVEAVCSRNSATTLAPQSDKPKSQENLADAAAVAGAQPLPPQPFAPTGGGNLQPGKASLDKVPAALNGTAPLIVPASPASSSGPTNSTAQAVLSGGGAAALPSGRTALPAAAPQPPISIVPAAGAQTDEASGSASPGDKQDASAATGPQECKSGPASDPLLSSAGPQAAVIASAQDQQSSEGVSSRAANRQGVTPGMTSAATLKPAATQRVLEQSAAQGAAQESGNPATASEMLDPANTGNAAVCVAQAPSKLPDAALPTLDDATYNDSPALPRHCDRPDGAARKQTANSNDPLPPAPNGKTDAPGPQFAIDSVESKANTLAQPLRPVVIRDQQQNPDAPSSVVLPVAGHPAASGLATRGDRSQVVSEPATSSAAENAQPAPTVIQSAQVLERMGKSEIRLGLNSSNFGSIELHTSVNQDRVGASITTSHADLRSAMIAEMPSLERAIAQHQMRLDSLQVDSRPGAPAGEGSASGGNQSGSRSGQQPASKISEVRDDSAAQEVSVPAAWTATHSGLNVHA